MSVERDRRANELFDRLLDQPAEERDRELERIDDEDLEKLVRQLLSAAEEKTDDGLWQAAEAAEATEDPGTLMQPLRSGDRVGSFEVAREVGRGGMAWVYLATRVEGGFAQRVALKVLATGGAGSMIAERFAQERAILGRLEHHGIAGIVDGGTLADGRPYFALEYVDGCAIDEYCQGRGLDLAERVRLMVRVCRTVHYAHRNLIVHRDLKPSNIFVTVEGAIKLLDFGIAKVLAGDPGNGAWGPGGQEALVTRTVVRLMTPSYASPEQVRGEAVTTASDVYQLGLLLYLLICGQPAQRFNSRAWSEIEENVCHRSPERPSIVAKRELATRVPEDLERIALMALRKEPDRRYASADQMAEDLERFLSGQPVRARADTWTYRAMRFVRRNQAAVASTGLLLVLLVAALVVLALQSESLAEQRDRAQAETVKAEKVSEFLVGIFDQARPSANRGKVPDALELLDRGRERLEKELSNEPEVLAMLLARLAIIESSLGRFDRSRAMSSRALEILNGLGQAPPTLEAHVYLALGNDAMTAGKYTRAIEHLQRSAEAFRRELGGDHWLTNRALSYLGTAHGRNEEFAIAESIFRRVVRWRKTYDPSVRLASDLNDLGLIRLAQDDLEGSERYFQEALAVKTKHLGEGDASTTFILNNLSRVLERKGHYREAQDLLRRSTELRRRYYPDDELPRMSTSVHNLARMEYRLGDLQAAEKTGREALEMRIEAYGENHPLTLLTIFNLALVLREKGEPAAAALALTDVHLAEKGERGEQRWLTILAAIVAGLAELDRGDLGERVDAAILTRARTYAISSQSKHWGHSIGARGHLLLARLAAGDGRWRESLSEFEKAQQAAEREASADRLKLEVRARWALALSAVGRPQEAAERGAGVASALSASTPRLRRLAERLGSEVGGLTSEPPAAAPE